MHHVMYCSVIHSTFVAKSIHRHKYTHIVVSWTFVMIKIDFVSYCHLPNGPFLIAGHILSVNFFSSVNDHIEDNNYGDVGKLNFMKCSCNTKVVSLGEIFLPQKISAII